MTVVAVMMLFAAVESVTGSHFLRETSRRLLGGPPLAHIEPRLGLHRAYASFDHPILYGIFCAGAFGFSVYVGQTQRGYFRALLRPCLAILATFFSLSSGAFSALGVQLFLVGWDRVTRGVAHRWTILLSIVGSVWGLITLLSNRGPIKVFLTYFTFSPGTGYSYAIAPLTIGGHETPAAKIYQTALPPLPAPPDLRAEAGEASVSLTWQAPELPAGMELVGYNLYRRHAKRAFPIVPVNKDPLQETRLLDRGLDSGKAYEYRVSAVVRTDDRTLESMATPGVLTTPQ